MPITPATQKAAIRRIMVQDQTGQKLVKSPSQQTSWVWWFICIIPVMWEA
jgi:hypothetical protein